MKTKLKNRLAILITLSLLFTLMPLPRVHADDKLYLSDQDVEVITFENDQGWQAINLGDGMVLAQTPYGGSNRFYDYSGKLVYGVKYEKNTSSASIYSDGYALVGDGIRDKKGAYLYKFNPGIETSGVFYQGLLLVRTAHSNEYLGRPTVGVMNTKGEWVIEPGKYSYENRGYMDGLIGVRDLNTEDYRIGYVNKKGELVLPYNYKGGGFFSEGLTSVYIPTGFRNADGIEKEGILSVIDKRGKELFRPKQDCYFEEFSHGLAATKIFFGDGVPPKYGFMNMDGELVIEPKYDYAGPFSQGLALVAEYRSAKAREEGLSSELKLSFINEKGETVFSLADNYYMINDMIPGLMDRIYRNGGGYVLGRYENGACLVYKDRDDDVLGYFAKALIDAKGREIRLDQLSFFKEGKYDKFYFSTAIVEGHALVECFEKGQDIPKTVLIKFKNPGLLKPYKVYNVNDYHYDVKMGYTKDANSDYDISGKSRDIKYERTSDKPVAAKFNQLNVTLDGKPVTGTESYLIKGNSYFKLRDIAALFAPTPKSFSINWNETKKLISVKTGAPYEKVGKELSGGDGKEKQAFDSRAGLEVNGKQVDIKAYDISGNNYYKLRDLADVLNLGLNWNEETMTIELSSK